MKRRKRKVRSYFCDDCQGYRPHLVVRVAEGGRTQRLRKCAICDRKSPLPGIHCPICGESWFRVWSTRHPCAGLTIRVKRCQKPGCTGEVRTAERLSGCGSFPGIV